MTARPGRKDSTTLINDLLRRIESLEKNRFGSLPDVWFDGTCTSVLGKGDEEDPRRINLKFDPDAANQIECREDGLFVGSVTTIGFDAIVDGSLVASDPDNFLFQGIGEALTYLNGLGYTRAFVLVRGPADPAGYLETAGWSNPAQVTLVGVLDQASAGNYGRVLWDHAGFSGSSASWQLYNLTVDFGAKGTGFSHPGGSSAFYADNCHFNCVDMTTATPVLVSGCEFTYLKDCSIDEMVKLGAQVYARNVEVWPRSTGCTLADTVIDADFIITNTAAETWTLPNGQNHIRIRHQTNQRTGSSASSPSITFAAGGGTQYIHSDTSSVIINFSTGTTAILTGHFQNVTLSGSANLQMDARCNNLTVAGPIGGTYGHTIKAQASGTVDITGPAVLDLALGTNNGTFRGSRFSGSIVLSNTSQSADARVNLVACDYSNLQVAGWGTGTSGTHKPYALDASSDNNIVTFAGASTYPTAGTDAGTANLITET